MTAGAAGDVNDGSSAAPELIGLGAEIAELAAGLDGALGGRGRLFLVTGEPGIGKTRLADELSRAAAARGVPVLSGRCWEAGGAPSYWPWLPVVAGLADAAGDALAVLEDLHAANESSLSLLSFVAREVKSTRALVLCRLVKGARAAQRKADAASHPAATATAERVAPRRPSRPRPRESGARPRATRAPTGLVARRSDEHTSRGGEHRCRPFTPGAGWGTLGASMKRGMGGADRRKGAGQSVWAIGLVGLLLAACSLRDPPGRIADTDAGTGAGGETPEMDGGSGGASGTGGRGGGGAGGADAGVVDAGAVDAEAGIGAGGSPLLPEAGIDGGVPDGGDASAGDAGVPCNDLENVAPGILPTFVESETPVGTGGVIADGVYVNTGLLLFIDSPVRNLPPGDPQKWTIRVRGTEVDSVDYRGATYTARFILTTVGVVPTLTPVCSTDPSSLEGGYTSYTATPNTLTFYLASYKVAVTFVRQ